RILHRLDENLLAPAYEVGDLPVAAATLELRRDDLVDVEEPVLLESDLDERGLHPRQDVLDAPLVDVPGDRSPPRALEIHLGHLAVLEHGDALLADVHGDEQLALGLRARAARDLCAAAPALAFAALRAGACAG